MTLQSVRSLQNVLWCKVSEKRDFFRCKMSALQNGQFSYQIFSNVAKCPKNAIFAVAKCLPCKMVVAKW